MSNQELIEGLRLHSTALEHTNRKATARIVAQAADALERYESPSTAQQAAPAERGVVTDFGREKLNATPYFIDGKLKGFNIDAEEYARLSRSYGSLNPAPAHADSDAREVSE